MHWADVVARRLSEAGGPHRIATGITPSGHIHVGNMREILTGDLIYRAARDAGVDATLYYIADDFDPLRKVYPFLPPSYSEHVGKPLSEIPAPEGGGNYADHFLRPFLSSLERLGVSPVVVKGSEAYRDGKYYPSIKAIMENMKVVNEILESVSGRELDEDWIPFRPKCGSCGKLSSTKPTAWEDPYVLYSCECGHEGKADTRKDDGKLPWRLDWPARWNWLGVTCEPFGKDHAASGGSYDTSTEIVRKVFGKEPPVPLVYEWIQLKGKGAMHSSTGIVITGADMLRMTPPEVLRFFIARNQPNKHLDMDPGLGILNLVDEFDRYEEQYFAPAGPSEDAADKRRVYELSLAEPMSAGSTHRAVINVPYRHLVTLVQLVDDLDQLVAKVKMNEGVKDLDEVSIHRLARRADCVRFWLDRFAPEGVRFKLYDTPPKEEADLLDEEQLSALAAMIEDFTSLPWDAESIHNAVYEGSRKRGIDPNKTFKAFYRVLMGMDRGPRLGFFLSNMERTDIIRRLRLVLEMRGKGV